MSRRPSWRSRSCPSRRGRGFGDQLLGGLIERARDEGYRRLSLSVEPYNPALKLYERYGFRRVEERRGALVMVAELPKQE